MIGSARGPGGSLLSCEAMRNAVYTKIIARGAPHKTDVGESVSKRSILCNILWTRAEVPVARPYITGENRGSTSTSPNFTNRDLDVPMPRSVSNTIQ